MTPVFVEVVGALTTFVNPAALAAATGTSTLVDGFDTEDVAAAAGTTKVGPAATTTVAPMLDAMTRLRVSFLTNTGLSKRGRGSRARSSSRQFNSDARSFRSGRYPNFDVVRPRLRRPCNVRYAPGGAGQTSVALSGNDFATIWKREPMPILGPLSYRLRSVSGGWAGIPAVRSDLSCLHGPEGNLVALAEELS